MSYTFNKTIKGSFEDVKNNVIEALKDEQFGIITEINMQATIKKKLNKDMQRFEILGACNPKYAYEAVMTDENLGVFLPCNITLSEHKNNEIKVAITDPIPYMSCVNDEKVSMMAKKISETLKRVSDKL